MDIESIRSYLSKKDLSEITHVERFRAYRVVNSTMGPVVIEVSDMGSSVMPAIRYSCSVFTEDGELLVTGNPDSSIEMAIEFVHWNELDAKLEDWMRRHRYFP